MYDKILIESLEALIKSCDERIDYYKKMVEEYPEDKLFEAILRRAEANKNAYEYELAQQKQNQ